MGVKIGNGQRVASSGEDVEEVLKEELTMESVGTSVEEVSGLEGVSAKDGKVWKGRIMGMRGYVELERGNEGGVTTESVAEEDVVGLHGGGGQEDATGRVGGEVVGALQDGWAGVAAFGVTGTGDEAGDGVFDAVLVEIGEEVTETLVGPALVAREEADEGVEDDEFGVDALDGLREEWEVLWEREGTIAWKVV